MSLPTISPAEAKRLLDQGATLIDIRGRDEHARERIEGARNLPVESLTTLDGDNRIAIFHCRSGQRTAMHAAKLAEAASCEAYIVEGGIEAWKKAGLPVARDRSQPIEIQRQVMIAAGSLVLLGVLLGQFVASAFYAVPAFVGAGLTFAGIDRLVRHGEALGAHAMEPSIGHRGINRDQSRSAVMPIAILPAVLAIGSGGVIGLVLGLVGGGGSILAVPLLVYVVGVPSAHIAIGTAAIAVALNAGFSLAAHARLGTVKWRCALVFAGAGVLGSVLGAEVGKAIDGQRLLALFGLVMVAVGLSMLRPASKPANENVRLTQAIRSAICCRA